MRIGLLVLLLASVVSDQTFSAEIAPTVDASTKTEFYELHASNTVAKFSAQQGANLFSLQVQGQELLWQPSGLDKVGGVSCGVPILYPTPNRVKNAELSFDGQQVSFPANAGKNFIHGLVNRHAWKVTTASQHTDSATIQCICSFKNGTELGKQFPFPHVLRLTLSIHPGKVRWQYEVDNSEGSKPVPFGFALHPYFRYLGDRQETYLTVPATHLMESVDKLPTGKLLPVAPPIGGPMTLEKTNYDDVFFGITPEMPARIEFRDKATTIEIAASEAFTHLVVWTPSRPFFGVESQTCSTDAHNLFALGAKRAAHLQVCVPGEKMSAWVQYTIDVAKSNH